MDEAVWKASTCSTVACCSHTGTDDATLTEEAVGGCCACRFCRLCVPLLVQRYSGTAHAAVEEALDDARCTECSSCRVEYGDTAVKWAVSGAVRIDD